MAKNNLILGPSYFYREYKKRRKQEAVDYRPYRDIVCSLLREMVISAHCEGKRVTLPQRLGTFYSTHIRNFNWDKPRLNRVKGLKLKLLSGLVEKEPLRFVWYKGSADLPPTGAYYYFQLEPKLKYHCKWLNRQKLK